MATQLWYSFSAYHNAECPYGPKGHPVTLIVYACSIAEAIRNAQFFWGDTHTIDPQPIEEPVGRLPAALSRARRHTNA